MRLYSDALLRLTELPVVPRKGSCAVRHLVRPYAERHVSKRLKDLTRLYLYREHVTESSDERKWLMERRKQFDELHASLPGWSTWRALTGVVLPPVAGFAAVAVGAESLSEGILNAVRDQSVSPGVAISAITAILFALVWIGVVASDSFAYKRSLFGGDVRGGSRGHLIERLQRFYYRPDDSDARPTSPREDVYAAEDAVWEKLGVEKRKEPLADVEFNLGSGVAMMLVLVGAAWLFAPEGGEIVLTAVAACLGLVLPVASAGDLRAVRRTRVSR